MIKYLDTKSPIHKVNSLTKYLLEIILIFSLPFLVYEKFIVLIVGLFCLLLVAKIPIVYFHKKLKFILFFIIIVIPIILIYPDMGIKSGLLLITRIYIIFGYVFLVVMTTKMTELVSIFFMVFDKFFDEKKTMKMTFIILLIVKFIPLLFREIDKIFLSLRTRGLTIKKGSIKSRINVIHLFVFALIRKMDNLIDEYDLILHSRNINYENIRNINMKISISLLNVISIVLLIIFIII